MKKYNLTDTQIKKIARLAVQENGEAAVSDEVSLMANLFELQSKRTDIYDFIRNGDWFSRAAYWMDNGSCTSAAVAKTKDVLVNGNRTLPAYVNEHDCFSDITSTTNNGKSFTKTDRSKYKKNVTIIKNRYGSTYTFYCFPTAYSDPVGYTADAYKKVGGSSSDKKEESKPAASTATSADKVIAVARNEVGYLEKKSNSQLDSKTANAGSGNYVKYWRDMDKSLQGEAWCGCFVNWCFKKAYGEAAAKKLTCGGLYNFYTPDMAQYYKIKGQWYSKPKKGDVIFFRNSERIHHVGIVSAVTSSTVYTIEGNTSAGSQVIPNGGAVCEKSYALDNSRIAGYGRPKYSDVKESSGDVPAAPETPTGVKEPVAWYGKVTASTLNVRKWAGVDNETCSFSPLKKGTKVGVCSAIADDGGEYWYYILYKGKHGFVSSSYIEPV